MLDLVFNLVSGTPDGGGDYTNTLSLTLAATEYGAVSAAPQFVEFEVTNLSGTAASGPSGNDYDPRYHDVTYLWDFDDATNATPMTPLNLPQTWQDLNRAYGRRVAHVFMTPRTHTVTCYAYEPATRRFGSQTIKVTVGDPKTVFPGRQTVIYDPSGVGDTLNYPLANVQTTWSGVNSARTSLGAKPGLILLAPGVVLANQQLAVPENWSNIRIGPLNPAGSRPTIGPRGQDGNTGGDGPFIRDWDNDNKELVVYGIDFSGDWDSTTQLGYIHLPFSINKGTYTGNYLTLFVQCSFSGFDTIQGPFMGNEGATLREALFDCIVTNWQDYGLFTSSMPNNATYTIGCKIEQNVNALSGGKKINMFNQHSCLRNQKAEHLGLRACSFFARNGWSISGHLNGYRRTAPNPAIRINAGSQLNASSYVDRCAVEGEIVIQDQNRSNNVIGNHVIDKMVQVLGSDMYSQGFEVRHGGVSIRNLLSVKLDLPEAIDSGGLTKLIFLSNSNSTSGNEDGPQKIYNATFVDLRNNAQADSASVVFMEESATTFNNVTFENNIFEQPNRSPAIKPDAPINLLTSIGVIPKGKGPRYDFLLPEGNLAATVSGAGGTLSLPYTQITDALYNYEKTDHGSPTDQAYWIANQASDTRHKIRVDGTVFHAQDGDFSVSFNASAVIVTNNSGTDWTAGAAWQLKLDRTSRLAEFDSQYDGTALTVPTAEPQAGSAAIGNASGTKAYDDLFGRVRPASSDTRGGTF